MKASASYLALFALLMGCTPVVSQRGYLQDLDVEAGIDPVSDTKTSIQQRLGYPSTEATFQSDAWYYISSVEKQIAFFHPTVESRAILAVYFDKNGKVTDIKHYTLQDGHVVDFETRETPSRGKELTFLQQLFNATPGVPIGAPAGNPGSGGPGGGGGRGGYP
ncbi:MAG: outer membrane protein assembly factor BamE [Alphaproteobacteria bacterium]|nr:outer membrane protein assembly factor BamE [Alphaproteobacteria bacterium]MBV9693446.1 outer membrane protein assembly factor BamE [Alphaproteobacteria bacterium]